MASLGTFFESLAAVFSVFLLLLVVLLGGCAPQATEIERGMTFVGEKVLVPVVEKALHETSMRTATLQGGIQGINPGYVLEMEGLLVNGFKGKVVVRVIGIAGQLQGHGQADQGQEATIPPPASQEVTTEVLTGPEEPPVIPAGIGDLQ